MKNINSYTLINKYNLNIKYKNEMITPVVESVIHTKKYGKWSLLIFTDDNVSIHRVFIKNKKSLNTMTNICVRVHSDCYTGDVLGSSHCDCGDQLDMALKTINDRGSGLIIFPANHEGRGIGLINKLKAYNLIKENKCDTYKANNLLGFPDDLRNYDIVPKILDYLKIDKIEILSNDKYKIESLNKYIVKITPLITEYHENNIEYMKIKNNNYGHVKYDIVKNHNIAIISTTWHAELINASKNEIMTNLKGHVVNHYIVPGAYEIPLMAKYIINKTKCDAVICLGLVLKGETAHFEYISNAVINGIMTVQLETGIPIINGILNCYTLDQAIERFEKISNSMTDTLLSVLKMRNEL